MEDQRLSTGVKKLQAVSYTKYVTKVEKASFFLPGDRLLTGNKAADFFERLETHGVVDATS